MTPTPHTRWVDIDSVRRHTERQLLVGRLASIGVAAVILVPASPFLLADAHPLVIVGLMVGLGVAAAGGAALVWRSARSRSASEAREGVLRIGVDPAALWFDGNQGLMPVPWDDIGGVRIMSSLMGTSSVVQSLYLDILYPGRPAVGPSGSGAEKFALRVLLPEAGAADTHNALAIARYLAAVIREVRPELWQGFTLLRGPGNVYHQSWDKAIHGSFSAGFGSAPTADNFGSRYRMPPGSGHGPHR